MNVLNKYEELLVDDLVVNPANDRHGKLDDEIDAMNWLLSDSEAKMKTLAKDIAQKGYVFVAPLVSKEGDVWVLHDGNRRVTCVKMLHNPTLAQDITWQRFFEKLASEYKSNIPTKLVCRVEEDPEVINDIVFRLHAGSETGVGTVGWDTRQQQNHAIRTGKLSTPSLGIQLEQYLKGKRVIGESEKLPVRNIERLLSSTKYREKIGIAYRKGERFSFVYPEKKALKMLEKVCRDLMDGRVTIDGLIKNVQKDGYFSQLETEGYTLNDNKPLSEAQPAPEPEPTSPKEEKKNNAVTKPRHYLIRPETEFVFSDHDDLERIKAIIGELQTLPIKRYVNAISVLFRVLIEACTNHYNAVHDLHPRTDKIHVTVKEALDHMVTTGKVDKKDAETLSKFGQKEELLSAHTFHGYVHSHITSPSDKHLCAMWDSFRQYVQVCASTESVNKGQMAA